MSLYERIGMDHLREIPDYYTRLAKMEKEAEAQHEGTSLRGYEAHHSPTGGGSSLGGIAPHLLQRFTAKKKRGLLTRTPLGTD